MSGTQPYLSYAADGYELQNSKLTTCAVADCMIHIDNMEFLTLDQDFFQQFDTQQSNDDKIRLYMCAIVALSSLNYPDIVPSVWDHAQRNLFEHLSHDQQFQAARKFREALIKSCGIVGAAKVRMQSYSKK